ncbi:MAG: ABC transporter transmembrane domain-containing protein [Saprospiraceae bacterium]
MSPRPQLNNFTIAFIAKLIVKYKLGVFLVIFFSILWTAFEIAVPFATKAVIDIGIQNQDMDMVVIILFALFGLLMGRMISTIMPYWTLRHIGVRVNLLLLVGYWERILRKSYLFFNNKEQSEIIQHFNDNVYVESFITTYSFSTIHSVINLVIYAIILFIFDVQIGIVFVFFTTLFILWSLYVLSKRGVVDDERFESSTAIRGEINEIFRGIVDIKSNNQEKQRVTLFEKFHYGMSKHRLNLLRFSFIQQIGNQILHTTRDVLILYFAAKATIAGTMTIGSLVAIQYLLGHLYEITTQILDVFPRFQDAHLSIGRVNESLSRHEPKENLLDKSGLDIQKKTIVIEDLNFRYLDDVPTLKGINMTIHFGRSVAILGESGSGKSTLMKNALKLLTPDNGHVTVGDYNLDHVSDTFWLTQCSTVLQESILFSRTLLYNITFCDDINQVDMPRMWKCLKLTLADDFVKELPDNIKTIVGKNGVNFSKGQIQRILLARAIYRPVSYYFFDEPFSALDRLTFRKVFKNIRDELKDATLVIVTHRKEVAEKMDEIFLLEHGRLVEHGNHKSLADLGDRYFQIFISDQE